MTKSKSPQSSKSKVKLIKLSLAQLRELATEVNPPTIAINSLTAVRNFPYLMGYTVPYYAPPIDKWSLDLADRPFQVFVHLTLKNNTGRVLTGNVSGFIANVALSDLPVVNLANGESVSGSVSFNPPTLAGQELVMALTFGEFIATPVPLSIIRATTTAHVITYCPYC